jgi:glycosyltransferase involved in cell wall biosynthesis
MAVVEKEAKRRHADVPFDLIYSRSLPMFGHVAGYWSKKELQLPWIANLNDPWDFHLFPVATMMKKGLVDRTISNFWMRQTFSHADLVTFPTSRLRDYHFKLAGRKPRSLVVPHVGNGHHGVDVASDPSTFHIVHAGKLGSNEVAGRPANALLMGLRSFLDQCPSAQPLTRLTLVGPPDQSTARLINQLRLEFQVLSVGTVNYEESLKYIRAASLCVLVESRMEEGIYLPSKLVDYLSAGKPVLALSPPRGVAQDLVTDGGIVRIDVDDADTVRSALERFYGDWRKGELQRWAPTEVQIRQFRPEVVAGNFLEAAQELRRAKRDRKVLSS